MPGLPDDAVVEIPTWVSRQTVRPMAVKPLPLHCLGLIQEVKAYERLTLEAVQKAVMLRPSWRWRFILWCRTTRRHRRLWMTTSASWETFYRC